MSDLPAPLVPAEVDLRDFLYMPLDVRRLLSSETWIDASEEPRLGHALICLWAESWHQVPAASLPDNDRVLARFAMCDRETWAQIKPKALKGWIKCSDGLLYHPVVAEKALSAWGGKREQKERTRAATEARQRQRREQQAATTQHLNGERNVERDDQRNVDRNVHQGRGKGNREGEGIDPDPGKYAFEGHLIRLTERDFRAWSERFRETIPDLAAELTVIDAKFCDQGLPAKQAFGKAAAWLANKHEMRLAERRGANGHGASPDAEQWRARVKGFVAGRAWLTDWGPEPLASGCMCPPPILTEFQDKLNARGSA